MIESDEHYEVLDNWKWQDHTIRRESGLIEHLCPHGIGHPSQGSALWLAEERVEKMLHHPSAAGDPPLDEVQAVEDSYRSWMTHGCDGCCWNSGFPSWRQSLTHAHSIIRGQNAILNSEVQQPDSHPKTLIEVFRDEGMLDKEGAI